MTVSETNIEWTDFSANFWEGCQKVGPGCDNCYAETRDKRFTGGKHWGPGAPRRKVKGGIAKLQKINRDAPAFYEQHGRWPRVFCSSLSDVFDNAVDDAWRREAFMQIGCATDVHIQLLTKRVGNVEQMIPVTWQSGAWPQHAGLMITVVNQEEANRDIPKLLELKARLGIPWAGLSMEPLLGAVDLTPWFWGNDESCAQCPKDVDCECGWQLRRDLPDELAPSSIDWVIAGGESGPNARPSHPDWYRGLRDQCEAAEVPFLFKQWGEWIPYGVSNVTPYVWRDFTHVVDISGEALPRGAAFPDHALKQIATQKIGKKAAGRLLDGIEHNGFPPHLVNIDHMENDG